MSTITALVSGDGITAANSMVKINTNFSNLNTDKIETSVLDTDTALTANSDAKIATQKATKAYADSVVGSVASETAKGVVEEATDAEVLAGTATGATGAKLFITPAKLLTHEIGLAPRAMVFSTIFEATGRYTAILNSGTNTYNTTGLSMDTTVTSTRAAGVTLDVGGSSNNLFLSSPVFACSFLIGLLGSNHDAYFGIGLVTKTGSGHTFTSDHAGFKLVTSGGVSSLFATQGNGTTESASSALTTVAQNDAMEVMLKINGTASIDYYWRKNGGAWSTATNLNTNVPDTASYQLQFSVSNLASAQQTIVSVASASYSR